MLNTQHGGGEDKKTCQVVRNLTGLSLDSILFCPVPAG